MNPSQKRASALSNEQIAYIKGCARLQLSIWKILHRDPLNALSDKVSLSIFRKGILALMECRERLRKQYLRTYLQKWLRLAQMVSLSNSKRETLLRGRIHRIEALKRFLLSQALKNWRSKAARTVEDFLGRIGAFMKLTEAGIKKRTKPIKKEFLQNLKKTIAPEYRTKPLKAVVNIYDKSQKLMKSRAVNNWKNKINSLIKRQLVLKNVVKPVISKNLSILRGVLKKWKHNAQGLKSDLEKMMLLRGHSTFSIYSKWNKANLLKTLSAVFNEWRRKAAIKPTDLKAKILQAKPHMLKHNININAEDLINGLKTQYTQKLRRDALKKLINKIGKKKDDNVRKLLQRWHKASNIIRLLRSKLNILLRSQVSKNDLVKKMVLKNTLKNWLLKTKSKEGDILSRYGTTIKLIEDLVKRALKEPKKNFLTNMKSTKNPNYYKKALNHLIGLYKRCEQKIKRDTMNSWHDTTKNIRDLLLKRTQLLKNRFRPLNQNRIDVLRRALNKWYNKSKDIKTFSNIDEYIKGNSIYNIYGKWQKFNRANILSSAFNDWRRRAAVKPVDYRKIIMEAKPHVLRHNINKNAEDLLNALRSKYYFANRQNVLRKVLRKGEKVKDFILRNALRKWYTNALKASKNNNILGKLLINNDFRMNNLIEKLLRKALYTWVKNASQPKTAVPNTEKACDLIRKATTEPFFNKLREKMQKKLNKDRFKSIIALVLRYQDKDLLRYHLGQWRITSRKLRAYDMNAIFLNQFWKKREDSEKFRFFKNLKDRANLSNINQDIANRILTNLFNKMDAMNKLYYRDLLGKYLYKWKANCGVMMKNPFDIIAPYLEGLKNLEKYALRAAHPDLVEAFDCNLTIPAQMNSLHKLVMKYDNLNSKDALKQSLRKWKENIQDRGQLKKLRGIFDGYTDQNRAKLFEPYKELCQGINEYATKRNTKTGVITDFLRGLKDLPNQMKSLKRTHLLLKIINRGNKGFNERLRSVFMDWNRRARAIKQESCSEVIQKFIRDKLQKRMMLKNRYEEACEHTKLHLYQQVLERIANSVNKNILKDILLKFFNAKDANNMKVLKDKFNKWNSLLPYLRRIGAATHIQSFFRGALVRDELNKFQRLSDLLIRIVGRYKSDPAPYFQKWAKNAKLLKAEEMDKIIQNFCRTKLSYRRKMLACAALHDLFKDYIHKQVAGALKEGAKFNPNDYEKFVSKLMSALTRQPYEKLQKGLRWIAVMKAIKFGPELFAKFRNMHLRNYLLRWLENGYLIPSSAANLIQAVYKGYSIRKMMNRRELLKQKLISVMTIYGTKKEDYLRAALIKWNKNVRKIMCVEDANAIRDFCRLIRERSFFDVQNKWKYLSHRTLPHQLKENSWKKFIIKPLLNISVTYYYLYYPDMTIMPKANY